MRNSVQSNGATSDPTVAISVASTLASEVHRLRNAAKRLLSALDRLDEGCREPGFAGWENGNGEQVGDEAEDADGNIFPNASWPGAVWQKNSSMFGGHHAVSPARGGYSLAIGARAIGCEPPWPRQPGATAK